MSVYLFTQNMLENAEVRKNVSHTPEKELEEFLRVTLSLKKSLDGQNMTEGEHQVHLGPGQPNFTPKERCTLKISSKVFLSSPDGKRVYQAVKDALESLGLDHFDSVVIAWPPHFTKEQLLEVWPYAENLVDDKLVLSLGVSDVDTQTFIDLYNDVRLKPEIVQINLEACCVVPPELAAFARSKDIQLLTHNDPADLLPKTTLEEVAKSSESDWLKSFEAEWIVRYQALVKCRGILKTKGYVLKLKKM